MLCDGQNYLFTQKTREFVTTKQMLVMDILKICNTFSLIHDDGDDNGVVGVMMILTTLGLCFTVNDVEDSTEFEFETALYYGDSTVNLGERFSITCIIPITDPINWLKDDEPIKLHNLRHGHDNHSYVLSESAIEGEFSRIL